jgi:DNA topoisomerase-3
MGRGARRSDRAKKNNARKISSVRGRVLGTPKCPQDQNFGRGLEGLIGAHAAAMPPIRVLNVAEKPSVAKEVSRVLNGGSLPPSRQGPSRYNTIWEFPYTVENRQCTMAFTSVTGHLMEVDFEPAHKSWHACNPGVLIEGAPVVKQVARDKGPVAENLQKEARRASWLILWLDCDREGENIAFEVLDVCRQVKPNIRVRRAQFSALSYNDVTRALATLRDPNENEAKAVDMRQELDLRIGSSFTRFNTMLLQNAVRLPGTDARGTGKGPIVSYGPCQFPTLGFIVQRKWDIDAHVPEKFWKIIMKHDPTISTGAPRNPRGAGVRHDARNASSSFAEFHWARERLFDRSFAETLFDSVLEARTATVLSESGRPTTRAPPLPLNTLEMQKRLNRAIRVSPDAIMKMAEELYQAGFISYPRTETDAFPNDFDYRTAIDDLCGHNSFGFHAQALASGRFNRPRAGGNNDNAHPPIYPTKLMSLAEYETWRRKNPNLPKVYEFVCRHFLACCSLPAVAHKTAVEAEMGGERFRATGLMIKEMNYLDVYGKGPAGGPRLEPSYDSWAGNTLPTYVVGQRFEPTELRLDESATAAPPLLSEVDLLQKMENHQIGTDATQAAHIEKVVGERGYAVKVGDNRLRPTDLGEGLVAGYSRAGLDDMWLPHKRAEMEADVSRVAAGAMPVDVAKRNATAPALAAFRELERRKHTLVAAVREFVSGGANGEETNDLEAFPPENGGGNGGPAEPRGESLGKVRACAACGGDVALYRRAAGTSAGGPSSSFLVACAGCASSRFRLPDAVLEAAVDAGRECENPACADRRGGRARAVELRMRARRLPLQYAELQRWSGCLFCDRRLGELRAFLEDAPRDGAGAHGGAGASPGRARNQARATAPSPPGRGGGRGRSRARDDDESLYGGREVRARGGRGRGGRGGRGARGGGDRDVCYKCNQAGHWANQCPNA